MDALLRRLERDALVDPSARFRLHVWEDRVNWPEGPVLTPEVDDEVEGIGARIAAELQRENGSRQSHRVELRHVENALGELFAAPESAEGIRSQWVRGTEVGYLAALSPDRAAHTAVLLVAVDERVGIGATKGTARQEAFFTFVRRDPRGVDGYVGEFVTPRSRPEVLREWTERAQSPRFSREAVERWLRRRRRPRLWR